MAGGQAWDGAKREIDRLIAAFFAAVSFDNAHAPHPERLRELFIDRGLLVDNAASATRTWDVDGFLARREAAWRAGGVDRFEVAEIAETTAIFGRIAHRASLFVRAVRGPGREFESRGAIFVQLVCSAGRWRISSAAWDDLRPGQPWATYPEIDEFG